MSSEETELRLSVLAEATSLVRSLTVTGSASAAEIGAAVRAVHGVMMDLVTGVALVVDPELARKKPAVPVNKCVTPDYIVCLDDGMKLKSLRRHITKLGYTPESYREYWGLPASFSLVCANYSAKRSELAKANGLGKKAA